MSDAEFKKMMAARKRKETKLRRFDIKKIYSDPKKRRKLIAEGTVVAMAREGITITLAQALKSYDEVMREKTSKR